MEPLSRYCMQTAQPAPSNAFKDDMVTHKQLKHDMQLIRKHRQVAYTVQIRAPEPPPAKISHVPDCVQITIDEHSVHGSTLCGKTVWPNS